MSADNWRVCPRCSRDAVAALDAKRHAAGKSYGKVSSEKYLAALKDVEVEARKTENMEPTFREDYSIGMAVDGTFYVEYSGRCKCGYAHRFKHEEAITP